MLYTGPVYIALRRGLFIRLFICASCFLGFDTTFMRECFPTAVLSIGCPLALYIVLKAVHRRDDWNSERMGLSGGGCVVLEPAPRALNNS